MTRTILVLCVVLVFSGCRSGSEFGTLVETLEAEGFGNRQHIPGFGLARTLVRTVHPHGVYDVKIAVFESAGNPGARLTRAAESIAARGWTPLVRASAPQRGEWSVIWAREGKQGMRILVLASDEEEASVVEVELDPKIFFEKMMKEPESLGDWD